MSHPASPDEVQAPAPDELPELARLPAGLKTFRGAPVQGAAELDSDTIRPRACRLADHHVTDFVGAWLSPEGFTAGYFVDEPGHGEPFQTYSCDYVWSGGTWTPCFGGPAPSRNPERVARSGGGLNVCDRTGGRRAFVWVVAPTQATWTLVKREDGWLAYLSSSEHRLVRITTTQIRRADQVVVNLVFLDEDLREVATQEYTGYVAG